MNIKTDQPSAHDSAEDVFFEPIINTAVTIYGQAGTPEGRAGLIKAVKIRLDKLGLNSVSEYAAVLRREPAEWNNLWPLALDSGGSFLRPAAQFDVARELLSEWAVMAPERTLRALSLGCGRGFETVSLAICLEEAGLRAKNWEVTIYGLDLNPEAVKAAEDGIFTAEDLNWLTEAQKKKWFVPRGGGFYFRSELAPPISLAAGNVYEPESWPFAEPRRGNAPPQFSGGLDVSAGNGLDSPLAALYGSFDLIFCRDLTLQAPPKSPRQLARILRQALAPTGFIFTAPGEFLPYGAGDFYLEERGGVTYYRRSPARFKANRHHTPRRERKGGRPDGGPAGLAPSEAETALSIRESHLLNAAAEALAENKPEAALALAREAMLAALDYGRPAPEAWAVAARVEEALGRFDSAQAAADAVKSIQS